MSLSPHVHHFFPLIESILCRVPVVLQPGRLSTKLSEIVGVHNCCIMHGSSMQRGKGKDWAHLSRGICHGYPPISSGPNATGYRQISVA